LVAIRALVWLIVLVPSLAVAWVVVITMDSEWVNAISVLAPVATPFIEVLGVATVKRAYEALRECGLQTAAAKEAPGETSGPGPIAG
jgi:hypothetical protein